MWFNRENHDVILKLSLSRPAIILSGVRQSGKSSLLKKIFVEAKYVTFDHVSEVEAAEESPKSFLSQFKNDPIVILDEVQYVPSIFRELKIIIDNDRSNYGKWILTGSQQFELMEKVSESLAGRISILHLETLSTNELRSKLNPDSNGKIREYLWKGGYPELWSNENIDVSNFFESYIRSYIERDLKTIIEVKNLNDFRKLLVVLATRVGQLLNYKDISKDIGISDQTVKSWVNALKISGLIYLLPPYFANIGKRLVKSPKLYFADHGLLSHLLGIENINEYNNHIFKGNIWENIVFMEFIKTHNLTPGNDIFFYRDHNGVEVDFIIEKKQKLFLVEAKAGEKVNYKKLNFDKVVPLFKNKNYKTETILAHNLDKNIVVKLKNYYTFNPILVKYDFKF